MAVPLNAGTLHVPTRLEISGVEWRAEHAARDLIRQIWEHRSDLDVSIRRDGEARTDSVGIRIESAVPRITSLVDPAPRPERSPWPDPLGADARLLRIVGSRPFAPPAPCRCVVDPILPKEIQ